MTREEFVALVKRHQAGDPVAVRELRTYADDPRMRRAAVARASKPGTAPKVPKVRGGDVPQRSRRSTPPPTFPAGSLSLPAGINRSAVQDVIETLGIKRSVRVRWATAADMTPADRGYRKTGEHVHERDLSHTIKLLRGRPREATSRTLVHELAHAAQAEMYGRRWQITRDAAPHKWEANARRIAWILSDVKLVR
jgi:hypothetical protein